jgi:hypothetical protein
VGGEMDVKIWLLVMLISFLSALYHAGTKPHAE